MINQFLNLHQQTKIPNLKTVSKELENQTIINNHWSARSCNDISELFSQGVTIFCYFVTEALGPYFRQKMLQDILNTNYTVSYDETTNNAGEKELQIGIRYWSISEQNSV